MSSELVPHQPAPLAERIDYSKTVAASALIPKAFQNRPADAFVATEYGRALGLEPIVALSEINVISGTPSLSASMMAALTRQAGHKLRVTGDDTSATCTIIRADDPDHEHTATWDQDKAKAAGLWGKGHWAKDPGTMLRWRAISECVRFACSEVLGGLRYTPEEVAEFSRPTQAGLAEVRIAQPTPPADDAPTDDSWQAPLDGSTPPEPSPPAPTQAQVRKMFAVLREAGFSGGNEESRDAMLAAVADIIGREIASSSDMTADEVSQTIDALDDEAAS